jgi:hypothetical protein
MKYNDNVIMKYGQKSSFYKFDDIVKRENAARWCTLEQNICLFRRIWMFPW